jgi:hypothetical protein
MNVVTDAGEGVGGLANDGGELNVFDVAHLHSREQHGQHNQEAILRSEPIVPAINIDNKRHTG